MEMERFLRMVMQTRLERAIEMIGGETGRSLLTGNRFSNNWYISILFEYTYWLSV